MNKKSWLKSWYTFIGKKGGQARAKKLGKKRRKEIARLGGKSRKGWRKKTTSQS